MRETSAGTPATQMGTEFTIRFISPSLLRFSVKGSPWISRTATLAFAILSSTTEASPSMFHVTSLSLWEEVEGEAAAMEEASESPQRT